MAEFEGLTQEANDALSLVAARTLAKQYQERIAALENGLRDTRAELLLRHMGTAAPPIRIIDAALAGRTRR